MLQQEEHRHFKWARFAKFLVGWASHIYYWVYPGVMVAFMGLVITYIIQSFVPSFGAGWQEVIVCVVFAAIVGFIAYIGIQGSTVANIIINVIQIVALVTLSTISGTRRRSPISIWSRCWESPAERSGQPHGRTGSHAKPR